MRLANFGYFGKMWDLRDVDVAERELRASFDIVPTPGARRGRSLVVIGAGAGLRAAGFWPTAWAPRPHVPRGCAARARDGRVPVGGSPGPHPHAAVWGASVVADSAQFSACVTELGDPRYMGTALTVQTCLGFLLTTVSIQLIPLLVESIGWRYAFAALAPGPALGTLAMLRLRRLPEASKIAQGRR